MYKIFAALFTTMIISALLVPIVRKFAIKVGAVDNPNKRRINSKPMPTLGGLAFLLLLTLLISFFYGVSIHKSR
jgi:UDP-N-acetylmuramyl pentapeptide phosphotransferase/UDP-N-acetylglucosamine-1-phosphate transferase